MQRKRPSARVASARKKNTRKAVKGPVTTAAGVADSRRAELVRAAYELIAKSGLEELRTRDIAARVGINISTLHYYFETKEELIAAVVDHMIELFRTVRAPLAEHPSALDELRHLFTTQLYRRRLHPELEIVVQEMLLRARRDERVRSRVELMLHGWNGHVEGIIARGVRDGDFARDLDPRIAAAVVTSYSIGTNLQHGVRPRDFPLEPACERLVAWLCPKK
ncbi:MAG TPA: TetR/AcrR family transcriptional regulator [Polyangiaceae bacterium]|nr:TetR/AcrR family transcriptional regulator [Polyangiaceae bacterium]